MEKTKLSLVTEELRQEKQRCQDYKQEACEQTRYVISLEATNDALRKELETIRREKEEYKVALVEAQARERCLQEKLDLIMAHIPPVQNPVKIQKLIASVDPETWDGDIWSSDREEEGLPEVTL